MRKRVHTQSMAAGDTLTLTGEEGGTSIRVDTLTGPLLIDVTTIGDGRTVRQVQIKIAAPWPKTDVG